MSTEAPFPQPQAKSQATLVLVLGILGIVCCGILAPIAWYLGNKEMRKIKAGQLPAQNEGMARAGMILGIVGSVLLVLGVLWVLFLGGIAVLQGLF